MDLESACDPPEPALARRCGAAVARLVAAYGWRLDVRAADALGDEVAVALAHEPDAADRLIEQTCCRLRFARLHAALASGGDAADGAHAR